MFYFIMLPLVLFFITISSALDTHPSVLPLPTNVSKTYTNVKIDTSRIGSCDVGNFDVLCDKECYCLNNTPCAQNGTCLNGLCKHGYGGPTCSECDVGFFGTNCSEVCHCLNGSSACNSKTGDCVGGCDLGYSGPTCQKIIGFPVIKGIKKPLDVNTGQMVVFSCIAFGIPQPIINITYSSGLNIVQEDVHKTEENVYERECVFGPTIVAGEEYFHCSVENIFGMDNDTFTVNIIDPPVLDHLPIVVDEQPESISLIWDPWEHNIDLGGDSTDVVDYLVEYKETGDGTWLSSGDWQQNVSHSIIGLLPDTVYDLTVRCRRHGEGGEGGPGPILQGATKCGLPNDDGIPQNLTIVKITSISVLLSWKAPSHTNLKCTLVKYILQYVNLKVVKSEKIEIDSIDVNYTLTNLTPNTEYEISLTAVTSGPSALKDAIIKFTTDKTIGGGTFYKQRDNAKTIDVFWDDPSLSHGKNYSVTAKLEKAGNCDFVNPGNDFAPIHLVVTNKTTANFDQLLPFSRYFIVIEAQTTTSQKEISYITVETPMAEPFVAPNLTVTDFGLTFLTVQWQPIPCHQINSNSSVSYVYSVYYLHPIESTRKRRSDRNSLVETKNISENGFTVSGLSPYSLYKIAVRGVTEVGEGPEASLQHVTVDKIPESPTILTTIHINSSTVTVQWRPPNSRHIIIEKYKIQYAIFETNTSSEPLWLLDDDNQTIETVNNYTTKVNLFNLKVGFTYYVRVAAKSEYGYGRWDNKSFVMEDDSSVRRVLTFLSPQPPSPIIVPDTTIGSNMVKIKIFPIDDFELHPELSYYDIVVSLDERNDDLNGSLCEEYESVSEKGSRCWTAARIKAFVINEDPLNGYNFVVGDERFYGDFFNGRLLANENYFIMIRTVDKAKLQSYSLLSRMAFKSADDFSKNDLLGDSARVCFIWNLHCYLFFALVIFLVILIWICIACFFICQNKNRKKAKFRLETPANISGVSVTHRSHFDVFSTEMTPLNRNESAARMETFKKSNFFGPIKVKDLAEYINLRSTHPSNNFEEEFKHVVRGQSFSWNEAKRPENIKKNRYGNILPYDQTRVILSSLPGIANSNYINASYVDGYQKPKAYIVAQGPKENTFHDFWRMVWQEKVTTIVMLTALVENKKKKCDQYWPNQSRLFGDILVSLTTTEHLADIVIRRFELKIVGTSEMRFVTHYHYADWPDLSVPTSVISVLSLRQRMCEKLPTNAGPITVHCSGGAGRSGTFVAIDALLKQAYEEDQIHVLNYVNKIRSQRTSLVQSIDQYKFVYEAVLEQLQSGNTKVICNRFPTYFRNICKNSDIEPSDMVEQFETLNNLTRRRSCFPSPKALTAENACKNRDPNIIPLEHSRVKFETDFGPSDAYINAILCDGLKEKGEFLVTQMPLDNTIEDFLHMIYQFKSSVIVMLNDCEFIDENIVPGQYWPNDGCTQYGPFIVEVVTFEEKGMVNIRTMRLSHLDKVFYSSNLEKQNEEKLECVLETRWAVHNLRSDFLHHSLIQLQFLDWTPGEMVPSSSCSLVALLNMTGVLQRKYGGPITVHCNDGASRSGMFCTAHVIKEQVEMGEVDVFQAVKRLRQHSPHFITSTEQYKFCHEIALELMNSFSISNFA